MNRRWKRAVDDEIDAQLEKYIEHRLSANRHFKKPEAVAFVLKRFRIGPDSDPQILKVLTEFYVAARASVRIRKRTPSGRRQIEGYHVPGEGHRYREARVMPATEFRAVTTEYVKRAEAMNAKAEFMVEVVEVAEQLGLFDADAPITAAYDQVVDRRGDDPLALEVAA